jgi:hypothetical protein
VIFTATSLQKFLECPRKYYNSQILGLSSKRINLDMFIGRVFHSARLVQISDGTGPAIKHIRMACSDVFKEYMKQPDANTNDLEIAEATLESMIENYPWKEEIRLAEAQFMIPIEDVGFEPSPTEKDYFGGRIDGMIKDYLGYPIIFDYKVKKDVTRASRQETMARHFQAHFYYFMFKKMKFDDLRGFTFILVRRPGIRPRRKPPEPLQAFIRRLKQYYKERKDCFTQATISYDPYDIEFAYTLKSIVKQIHHFKTTGEWYCNYTACCIYNNCVYLPACEGQPGWEDLYNKKGYDIHPELELEKGVKEIWLQPSAGFLPHR